MPRNEMERDGRNAIVLGSSQRFDLETDVIDDEVFVLDQAKT